MSEPTRQWTRLAWMVAVVALPAGAAEDPALLKDMTAVIALQAKPCGQAVSVVSRGENDHLVTCQDGHRYRVVLNAEGRVLVQKP